MVKLVIDSFGCSDTASNEKLPRTLMRRQSDIEDGVVKKRNEDRDSAEFAFLTTCACLGLLKLRLIPPYFVIWVGNYCAR